MATTMTSLSTRLSVEEIEEFTRTTAALGLTTSSAIKVFVRMFNECGGFPFDVRRPVDSKSVTYLSDKDYEPSSARSTSPCPVLRAPCSRGSSSGRISIRVYPTCCRVGRSFGLLVRMLGDRRLAQAEPQARGVFEYGAHVRSAPGRWHDLRVLHAERPLRCAHERPCRRRAPERPRPHSLHVARPACG